MSVIGKAGRKRFRARFAMAILFLALSTAAVTTLYPFAVMITLGFKGPTDQNDNKLIPGYWSDDKQLLEKYVDDKYAGNVDAIAATRGSQPADSSETESYRKFLAQLPNDYFQAGFRMRAAGVTSPLMMKYQSWLKNRFSSVAAINQAYVEEALNIETVVPPAESFSRSRWKPTTSLKWSDWQLFKSQLSSDYRIPVTVLSIYRSFAAAEYHNDFSLVPGKGNAKSFSELQLPSSGPLLEKFRSKGLPARYRGSTVESLWLDFQKKPHVLDALAASAQVHLPIEADERAFVAANARSIRFEFLTRNYRYIFSYLALNGRALWNTVIYCGLAIIATLFVNTLAAYALSRYPIRASGKILVFLLATMAFPTEVTMIPNFLLLKNLHLLNTYAALVLPTAASGYLIFLLKGFFDSLPQELFEAGSLDGAKESMMLLKIALPLSRPVLGYFALITFIAAYGNFLYAFLVAQDQRIWTVTVFLYQLSGIAPKYVMMAGSTIAAMPTLIVFLLTQKIIMRGIVLPGER